jgi:hypothetical protein
VRLLSEAKGLASKLLNDVVVKHLQAAHVDIGGNMEARIERLLELGSATVHAAVAESASVRASKKAARQTQAPAAAAPASAVPNAAARHRAGSGVEKEEEEQEGEEEEEEEGAAAAAEAAAKSKKHRLLIARDPAAGALGITVNSCEVRSAGSNP